MAIYFIQAGGDGPIKIGVARQPLARLQDLQAGNHEKLTLIGLAAGGHEHERKIHAACRNAHIHREWFDDCPLVRSFIEIELHAIDPRRWASGRVTYSPKNPRRWRRMIEAA